MPLPPPPPPAPPPPPPPVAASAPPPKTKDRAALLVDIQKGRALKKVETNDRSAPVIDAKTSGASSGPSNPRPGPGGGGKFHAPAAPSGPMSFADELNRRLGGGGGRGIGKSQNEGGGHATNAGTSPVITPTAPAANTAAMNGVSRPLPPPPPPSGATPSLPTKPVPSHQSSKFGPGSSVKPMAPQQPGRVGGQLTNGHHGRNEMKPAGSVEGNSGDDGRLKGPSVRDRKLQMFASANMAPPPPPQFQTGRQRTSNENTWNGECHDDGSNYAAKSAPPPPPSKPPSKPPQKDSRFHTLNPSRAKQQQANMTANIPRSGSHENLPAASFHPPAPPPKVSTVRSPGSVSRPAPPPPGRPPPPPERPQVAPPPPPPPAAMQQKLSTPAMNGRHNAALRNNGTLSRNPCMENSPAPPPPARRESLMPDLERRFTFLPLRDLPPPEEFRGKLKVYPSPTTNSQQHRSRAPEPPGHR